MESQDTGETSAPVQPLVMRLLRPLARVRVWMLNRRIGHLIGTMQLDAADNVIDKRNRTADTWIVKSYPCDRLAINVTTNQSRYMNPDYLPEGWIWVDA